jgi:hypothetical protein
MKPGGILAASGSIFAHTPHPSRFESWAAVFFVYSRSCLLLVTPHWSPGLCGEVMADVSTGESLEILRDPLRVHIIERSHSHPQGST